MSEGGALLDIIVVLLAAKAAAEISHRLGIPGIVGEILAGILIGPSLLGFVTETEVLGVLAELGVILLLVEVGMQMDVVELARVGRSALLVALIGVVLPFAGGYVAVLLLGFPADTALFVGAALTATSVGITARVFSDLGVLAGVEARTVVGAAIADDVIGLVILGVVTASVGGESLSAVRAITIVLPSLVVLVVATAGGAWLAPRVFDQLQRWARSPGTLVALSLAFILIFSVVAELAGLAPVIGAFIAGLALARSAQSDRIHRELAPVGHLFIPVFFLQIGIQVHLGEFADPSAIGLASVLLVVAIVGKMLAGAGSFGARGDKLLIGLGMLPRGEVGLIFAAIGLRTGIFDQQVYGALLLVVLGTTLLAPPLLRWRIRHASARSTQERGRASDREAALVSEQDLVELSGEPSTARGLQIGLETAVLVASGRRPGPRLVEWLSALPGNALRWDVRSRELFTQVLEKGNPRSWLFLQSSGLLERTLPELAQAIRLRRADPFELDPTGPFRWTEVERLHELLRADPRAREVALELHSTAPLYLSALVLACADDRGSAVKLGRRLTKRLDLGAATEQQVATLVGDPGLLRAGVNRPDFLDEDRVLQATGHLRSADTVRCAYLLTLASNDLSAPARGRLDQLARVIQQLVAQPGAGERRVLNLVERRRAEALALSVDDPAASSRVSTAPRSHILAVSPADVARHASLLAARKSRKGIGVAVEDLGDGACRIEIATKDRYGLLAHSATALDAAQLTVTSAVVATWSDGMALQSFVVLDGNPSADEIEAALQHQLRRRLIAEPFPDARVEFDNEASPWYSLCAVSAKEGPWLLRSLAVSITHAGGDIRSAAVSSKAGRTEIHCELTDRSAGKLSDEAQERIGAHLRNGVQLSPRRWTQRRSPTDVLRARVAHRTSD
ncbi:MAG: hypothetical protein QOH26_553 [Actinomycetota bacterium]|nr:hypothetical protein [Actinomycetota bacterium]